MTSRTNKNGLAACSAGLATVCLLVSAGVAAQEEVETYTVPKSVEPISPDYPVAAARRGEEGLVAINFMVDTEGNAFDPVIVDYTGSELFHEVALEALLKSRFQPAELDGEPIVGSANRVYRFDMQRGPQQGASEQFARLYRSFRRVLGRGDQNKIEDALADLEALGSRNHYESAYLNLARYNHAVQHGTPREQMTYLTAALSKSSSPDDPVHLDERDVRQLRRALLPLQISNNRFPEALDTYRLMEASGDEEAVALFKTIIEEVEALALDDTEYAIPLELDAAGSAWVRLYKGTFALAGGQGALQELKLRCEQQYVAFAAQRDSSYEVPEEWGACSLQVLGDSGAAALLFQR